MTILSSHTSFDPPRSGSLLALAAWSPISFTMPPKHATVHADNFMLRPICRAAAIDHGASRGLVNLDAVISTIIMLVTPFLVMLTAVAQASRRRSGVRPRKWAERTGCSVVWCAAIPGARLLPESF
jgi:hypothetical protein